MNIPSALCIAGFDPSGGAGLLADQRVFNYFGIRAYSICTAQTIQNDESFRSVEWSSLNQIEEHFLNLPKNKMCVVKIGLVQNFKMLQVILNQLEKNYLETKIVWDPVLSSSTGFDFDVGQENQGEEWISLLQRMTLLTPNRNEVLKLAKWLNFETEDAESAAKFLSEYCAILLKDGHGQGVYSTDRLYEKRSEVKVFSSKRKEGIEKRGTGCALSSAIASGLILGDSLIQSCQKAKDTMKLWFDGEGMYGRLS